VNSLPTSSSLTDPPRPQSLRHDLKSLRLAAAVIWTLTIMTLCWLPAEVVQEVEEKSPWFAINNLDKAVHCGIFVVFALLWARVWRSRRRYAWVGLMGLGLATLTEIGQLLPAIGREASVADAATDMLGCVIGLALVPWLEPLLRWTEARLFGESKA
jgi:VanZ family protein